MLPPLLKSGDTIGIVAFAKKISLQEIQPAVKVFESWGLKVRIGKTIGKSWNQFSGTDDERMQDLQEMLDDPEVKAVISARGGYGSVRIIDDIDFSRFVESPKWLIGFSDITVFHAHIHQQYAVPTLHATMPVFFPSNSNAAITSLKQVLFEGEMDYQITSGLPNLCKDGGAETEIIGGNLSILYSICGSRSGVKTDGKILYLEDLCEYLYHTDRMLQNLKRNGFFENIKGLIIGSFTDMKDGPVPFGQSVQEMIFEFVKDLNIPVFADFPAGHIDDNRALIFGQKVLMEVQNGRIVLKS